MPLLELTDRGLFCPAGGFHVDPWGEVDLALLTHAHGDHARPGSARYLAAAPGAAILEKRLAPPAGELALDTLPYGARQRLGDVTVSFHPAGHVLGSAQLRVEGEGEVWVVTGDFKRAPDPTCAPFEPVEGDVLVTEATFALPIYRWAPPEATARAILAWWDGCAARGQCAVLYATILGKAQRLLAELARLTDRRVWLHGAIANLVDLYREAGVAMLPTARVADAPAGDGWAGRLVLAPPSVRRTPWVRRFGDHETAFASGWMQVRGMRRRRGLNRGFALSDHADWAALLRTVDESRARRVLCTHGYAETLARFLREERGLDAEALTTRFEGEEGA